MPTILRFDEPLRFEPFTYLGLDQYEVFIHEEGPSYNYFGFTRIPDELTAGRNLLAFTATKNLVVGSEIAIEVMDAMGNLIPVRTADYIGDGKERIFSIEIDERVPQGDAVITVMGVAKGRVQFDARNNLDRSESVPNRYFGRFNIRWQKRLQCNPAKRNTSDILYFENPDIVVEEVLRPYHTLHYNPALTSSYTTLPQNTSSLYTLCSTGSAGVVNTSASIRYEVQGDKYYIFAESNPDFGGFTDDMIGGTIFFPEPNEPFPKSVFGPYAQPVYNQLEDGDGQGELDTGSQEYSMQGAYNTFIIERLSPLQMRVNSPHTTFQGSGRYNQKEIKHQRFGFSDFRLDFAQNPVSASNDLASGSNEFLTSYAKVTFDKLTPLVGDVTRIKTYVRSDQTANEFQLQADIPVVSQEMLVQTQSSVTRHPAGDFSAFGVSSSIDGTQGRLYWTSSAVGSTYNQNPDLSVFRAETDALLNPIVDSLMIGSTNTAVNLTSSANYWLVDSTVPMLMQKDQYYQVEFKAYGVNVGDIETGGPKLGVYIDGEAMNDATFGIGKLIGEISDIENNQLIAEEDPLDDNKSKGAKFTFQADATGFGYLRFKVENGLWYIAEVSCKPYDQFGYTPHHFESVISLPKANVREMDALDFRFEFYNSRHHKAAYVSEIHNLQFENRYTAVFTNTYIQSASIDNFFATTPIGDSDWAKVGFTSGQQVQEMPELTESIYHSGSVGIGNFAASTVNYPLHVKKDSHEGNTTIKVESFSSSILHLAANQGSTYPNSRSAFILFDHANTLTSSIMGYTEVEDQDPGGVTMSGSTKGSFTIHERHGRVMSLGVGGTSRFHLVTGKSEGFRNAGSHGTFIGHQNPIPGTFDYELDVSGSIAVRSGTIFLPNITESTSPPMLLAINSSNETVKTNYNALFQNWNDDDWFISTHYITQSRDTANTRGKTVWIGDGNVITGLTPNEFIFQISQSGVSPKVRLEGIVEDIPGTNITNLLGLNGNGNLYKTTDVGSLHLWKDKTTFITSSVDIFVSGNISASGDIVARQYIVESYTSSQLFSAGGTQFGDGIRDFHSFSGSIYVSDDIELAGSASVFQLTASSNISASGDLYGDSLILKDQPALNYSVTNDRIVVGNKPTLVQGNLTASLNISASEVVYASRFRADGSLFDTLGGHVTASGNISASEGLYISSSINAAQTTYQVLVKDPATGKVYHTGSYGVGGSGGGTTVEGGDKDWFVEGTDDTIPTAITEGIWTSGSIRAGVLNHWGANTAIAGVPFGGSVMIGHGLTGSYTSTYTGANNASGRPYPWTVLGQFNQELVTNKKIGTIIGAGTGDRARFDVARFATSRSQFQGQVGIFDSTAGAMNAQDTLRASLDIRTNLHFVEDPFDSPIRVDSFPTLTAIDRSVGTVLAWDADTKYVNTSPCVSINAAGTVFANAFVWKACSPGAQLVSGSFQFIHPGATANVSTGSEGFYTGSAVFAEFTYDSRETGSGESTPSFMITGSGFKGIYFTQSSGVGKIGIGTDNPEDEVEIHSDKIKFRRKTEDKGVEMNDEGNFESFAYETAGASTGSELILKFARGTKASPVALVEDDVLGSIRWVQDSGSLDGRSSGEMAAIRAVVVDTDDAGTTGKLELALAAGPAEPAASMLTLNGPTATSTFAGTVVIPDLNVGGAITHNGDPDTKITFTDDDINIKVGNVNMLDFTQDTVSEVTFNEAGADVDFRIESAGDTKAFYINAGNNAIQLGSAATTHVTASGNISSSGALSVFGEVVHLEGTDPRLKLKAKGANHPGIELHEDSTRKWVIYNDPDENDNLTFKNDSIELVKISQTGGLKVSGSGGHVTASGNISASGYFEGNTKLSITQGSAGDANGADVVFFGTSETLTAGGIYYWTADSTWVAADATTVTKGTGLLGVARGTGVSDGLVLRGIVTLAADPGTVGDKLYLSTTAIRAQSSAPTTSGYIVRVIGYSLNSSNKQVYFNPDNTWIELT